MKYALGDARDWVRETLRGYLAVLYTPFREDGSIDEAGLRHNVNRTLSLPGVGGLSVNALHQEFWTLTDGERKRLVEIVLEKVAGRAPVVVGCSDPSADKAVDFAQHAAAAGADLVMAWPPFYGPRSAESVRRYYEYVAGRIGIGLILYSTTLPELGYYLAPLQVEALLGCKPVCAVQNTTFNLAQYGAMLERVGSEISVATSLEEYHLFGQMAFPERAPHFLIGSSRPILCQTAEHPHCGRFVEAIRDGDIMDAAAHARRIMAIADRLQSRYFAQGFHHVGLFKHVADCLGMRAGSTRPGVAPATEAEREEVTRVLREFGLLA
ncbi:dihydrodipicolinate synthase family protein [Roseomonas xinghualingensis]|uniref:dihydrodipicolinate synthase family protein n=1 Tax=Roseomonas xinghualingensis TaxID=2986475 RepID=UPI0021F0F7E5|nr:dihydrodipicolinate synthase family protein [Roseomonas sp. SXEYE001]MCV4209913.1 dihydrodipicolinate synthase family protein [Roseomonas sp. SXEYE001]